MRNLETLWFDQLTCLIEILNELRIGAGVSKRIHTCINKTSNVTTTELVLLKINKKNM